MGALAGVGRKRFCVCLGAPIALLLGTAVTGVLTPRVAAAEPLRAVGVRATSGDTLVATRLSENRLSVQVHVAGIRAPRARACLGNRSKTMLNRRIAGRTLILRSVQRLASRLIRARVFENDRDVGGWLVSQGMARADLRDRSTYAGTYRRLEARARRARRGIWRACIRRETADLAISVSDSPDPVRAGSALTYSLVVRNDGPFRAQQVHVFAQLPASLHPNNRMMTIDTPGRCVLENTTWSLNCTVAELTHHGRVRITVTVQPQSAGLLRMSTTVDSSTPDPDRSDNAAAEETSVAG